MLKSLYRQFGKPPLWRRPQNFRTLVHIVLEQKVSLASALAVMQRVDRLCPSMQAEAFLQVAERDLRRAGISARKLSYCRSIAEALASRQLRLAALRHMPDTDIVENLCSIRGVGPWTAGVYLLMAMRRPDAWASGDRALALGLAEADHTYRYMHKIQTQTLLPVPTTELAIPDYSQLDQRALAWKPFRGAACRLIWHSYLSRRQAGTPSYPN